jgi:hypothetical protein
VIVLGWPERVAYLVLSVVTGLIVWKRVAVVTFVLDLLVPDRALQGWPEDNWDDGFD